MKTMNDVKKDMSVLYDEVRRGATYLKAEQLQLAREVFMEDKSRGVK